MASYQPPAQPTTAERVARWAVVVLLLVASLTLAFGLGFAVKDVFGDDDNGTTGAAPRTTTTSNGTDDEFGTEVLDEIVKILQDQYVDRDELDPEQLKEAAISGILESLNDRETSYISQDQLKEFTFDSGSSYEGIGATVTDRNGAVEIVAPYRDSPAEKAGVRAGDVILAVEGESTEGWTDDQAVEKIRGPKGSPVEIEVRHTDGTTETLTIERGEIPLESVFREPILEVIPGESDTDLVDRSGAVVTDIAYVNISRFRENTADELREKARDIESKGYKGLILDLRSNPGGYLTPTVHVADEFLDDGTIITEVDADGQQQSTGARSGGLLTEIPVVVLMDAGSASGAEVLAAAIRDNGRGKIVGTRSFGKGTVNIPVELKSCGDPKGCGALYIAIGRWLTPSGDQIEGLGVTPDIEVPMTSEQYIAEGDLQVFKAIEVLRGQ
ncbi:MAG: S41 family peptidase [Dehalococcoidia bacterium]|nr:S41 family peptidase [Dehalococcoidia bacterium]